MYVSAIVLAAGRGLRFDSIISKPLVKINSRPIIIYCLKILNSHPAIKEIILVVNPSNRYGIIRAIREYRIAKVKGVILGGRRRQDSTGRGLGKIDKRADLVLIHDAARPFIDRKMVTAVIREASASGAAIAGVPVKATIKEVKSKNIVKETLDRSRFWEIQTPQAFKKDLILRAFRKFGRRKVTDDAMLVEKLGKKVSVVMGSYRNIKITTPEDLVIAEAIADKL